MAKKIEPFSHVIDLDHIEILPTIGLTIHGLKVGDTPLKFIILITVCAIAAGAGMIWLGRKMRSGEPPRGKLWNLAESLLFFVRDKIAIPGIGQHDANKYLPYLTTLFLFIFAMNLIGMVPFLGSPTASIMVTGALALVSFVVIHASAVGEMGTGKCIKA